MEFNIQKRCSRKSFTPNRLDNNRVKELMLQDVTLKKTKANTDFSVLQITIKTEKYYGRFQE